MSDDRNGRNDDRSVVAANIGAAIIVLLLILGGYRQVQNLAADRKVQDCFLSGRHDCVPIDANHNG
jgi:hypothetical protein